MITSKTFELLTEMALMQGNGSRKSKQKILTDNIDVLKEYFDIAMNPYRVFNIAKIPDKSEFLHKYMPKDLTDMVTRLEACKGGTKENKHWVRAWLDTLSYDEATWCKQAILKNVKLGVEAKTLNKCGYDLPVWKCLLATPNPDNDMSGIQWPAYIQPKLDGCRATRLTDGNFYSRGGRTVANIQVPNHIRTFTDKVIDGEFFSFYRKFNAIFGYFSSDDQELPDDIKFVIFNVMNECEWREECCTTPYADQLKIMADIAEGSHNIVVIPTYVVNSPAEALKKYEEFMAQGFEGAMLRNMNTTYKFCDDSSRAKLDEGILVKLKPFEHVDCKILSCYEGSDRNAGRLGGFEVDFEGKTVNCGGGFSDELREQYWRERNELPGQWIRAKLTERTEANSMRFPIFESLRDAK